MSKNPTSMELESDRAIVISRTFNGRARVVFDAWTKPELVRRWWAPQALGVSFVHCEADVRVGGRYRYVLRTSTGAEFGFFGTYTVITPYSRLVYTQALDSGGVRADTHGDSEATTGEAIITITFEERDGKTHLVAHELYPSKEARAGALAAGMEHGMRLTMDQLDELVASLTTEVP